MQAFKTDRAILTMKVLHVKSTMAIGGAERLMTEMLPLMKKEIEVELLINEKSDSEFYRKLESEGIKIHSLNYPKLYSPLNVFRIVRWLRQYDLVHVHLFPSLYFVAVANFFIRKPLIYTEHSTYNKRRDKWYLRPIEKWIYSRYQRIISISEKTNNNLKQWIKAKSDDKRFVIINNGIDLTKFFICRHTVAYPHTLIMIARFSPAKDQATIIKALTLLSDNVHLILVGDGVNRKKCEQMAVEIGVGERVHFTGQQADVIQWIEKADIGIQSSNWEGFGLTAVEMMAGGLPVIATEVDGLKQVVEGAGELFKVGDYHQLAKIIKHLISDESYYHEVQRRCTERVALYDIKRMTDEYINIYKRILGDGNR